MTFPARGYSSPLLLATALLLTACPRGGQTSTSTDWMAGELQRLAPPPSEVRYTRANRAGPMPLPDVQILETWQGPTLQDGLLLYDVETFDVSEGQPDWLETVRHFFGPDGYGYLGTRTEDGTLERWEPRQVVLPPNPEIGQTWTASHVKGDQVSERTCEIMASELCDGGLVSVCDSKRGGGRIVLRDHFCPGVGWSGFEAMVVAGSKPPVRMWSEGVTRDGVALPDAPTPDE